MTFDGSKALEAIKHVLKEGGLIKAAPTPPCGCFLLAGREGWTLPLNDGDAAHSGPYHVMRLGQRSC
jgi:hypothetical protein